MWYNLLDMTQEKQKYEHGRIAVDPVIFTIKDRALSVYLNFREKEPFMGLAELPGGLLRPQETAEETLHRKLESIIGSDVFFEQFHTFTQPDRDPRIRTVSIAFIALVAAEKVANSQQFIELSKIPKLAFDHGKIVDLAHTYLKQNLNHNFAKQFLPRYFPLNDLQEVYEVIEGTPIDNRNFRKKMLDSGTVKKVAKKERNVSHRPAQLYTFTKK